MRISRNRYRHENIEHQDLRGYSKPLDQQGGSQLGAQSMSFVRNQKTGDLREARFSHRSYFGDVGPEKAGMPLADFFNGPSQKEKF